MSESDIDAIVSLLHQADADFRSARSGEPGLAMSVAVTRVRGMTPATQAMIHSALRNCRGAIDAFAQWDTRFQASLPDNFVVREGESDAAFRTRRATDRSYYASTHPAREGRRQEAGVAYRNLPSCELALAQLLTNSDIPDDTVRSFATQLDAASTATRTIIDHGISQEQIMAVRKKQILAYHNMAEILHGRAAEKPSKVSYGKLLRQQVRLGTKDPELRYRTLRERVLQWNYATDADALPTGRTYPESMAGIEAVISSGPLAASVNAIDCGARTTEILASRHAAGKTDRVVIQFLYGEIEGMSAKTRAKDNLAIAEGTFHGAEKYLRRYRIPNAGRYAQGRRTDPRPATRIFTVYVDAKIDYSKALRAGVNYLRDGEFGPGPLLRATDVRFGSPHDRRRLFDALSNTTARSEIWLSGHGDTFHIACLDAHQIGDFLLANGFPRDAHCKVKLDACLTGGNPQVLAHNPGKEPLSLGLHQHMLDKAGVQSLISAYNRSISTDGSGVNRQYPAETGPVMTLLTSISRIGRRQVERDACGNTDMPKVPDTKVNAYTSLPHHRSVQTKVQRAHDNNW